MKSKETILAKIKQTGLVAVIRAENSEHAYKIVDACIKGGIVAIEITFTVPKAHDIIGDLTSKYGDAEIIIGAGTVLDAETARVAILSGAQFIVSPYLDVETVKLCNRYQVACMPGAMTLKETVECMEAGADIIKIFPGELFGPKIIKAIKGPIPSAKLMPTGGVNLENVGEWIKAGAIAVGVGGSLTSGSQNGDYEMIVNTARQFIARINEAKA